MVNIVVVFPKTEDAKNVKSLLVRNGFDVAAICTTGAQAIHYADGLGSGIIISAYKFQDMLYSQIKECLPEGFEMLLLASRNHLEEGIESDIVSLPVPFTMRDLLNTVDMMTQSIVRWKKRQRLQPAVRSGEEKQQIEEAKKVLMERNHFSEEEAHRYLQKCSMDSGTNLIETAQMILCMRKN